MKNKNENIIYPTHELLRHFTLHVLTANRGLYVQGGQKSKPLPNDQKIVGLLNRIKTCEWDDLFVILKYESSTLILLFETGYSMRDLLSDLNNYAWPSK